MLIVKVPCINGLGKTKGCEKAGNAILSCLNEIYSNEEDKEIDVGALEVDEIDVDNGNLEEANKLIYENSLELFQAKSKIIFLGGDHSISYSLSKAFLDYCKINSKEPCLIVFDAHPDCMPNTLIKTKKIPTHEEWLRALIDEGFPKENVFLVGIRNSYPEETEFLKKNKIKVMKISQIFEDLDDSCDVLMEFSEGKDLYISIDIDVIDPAFAPGTGYKEPGGLTSREFIYFLKRFNKLKNLKSIDIVEINPELDNDGKGITVKLGAKILAEMI